MSPIVWLSKVAYNDLIQEADRAYPLETGGVLVGYVADEENIVLSAVSGPGPNASHEAYRFTPDHDWQCSFLDTLYRDSLGENVYLGDWHTHPDGVAHLSRLDKKTLHRIASHEDARCSSPVMLISAGKQSEWELLAHRYCRKSIWSRRVQCRQSLLRLF